MNSSNKHFYNKNQTIVEHGVKKTFYMNENNSSNVDKDALVEEMRQAKREEMIQFILTHSAEELAEEFYFPGNPHSGIIVENDSYIWNLKALKDHDDLALSYKVEACKRLKLKTS